MKRLYICMIVCLFILSCSVKKDDYYIVIDDGMDKQLISNFIKGKEAYFINDGKVYCRSIDDKNNLKKYLIFNDLYFSSNSDYRVIVNYKSEGELYTIPKDLLEHSENTFYLPEGIYRVVIPLTHNGYYKILNGMMIM